MRNRHRFGFSVACRIDMHAETSDLVAGGGGGVEKEKNQRRLSFGAWATGTRMELVTEMVKMGGNRFVLPE